MYSPLKRYHLYQQLTQGDFGGEIYDHKRIADFYVKAILTRVLISAAVPGTIPPERFERSGGMVLPGKENVL